MLSRDSPGMVVLGFFLGGVVFIAVAALCVALANTASSVAALYWIYWIGLGLLTAIDVFLFLKAKGWALAKGAAISVSMGLLLSAICGAVILHIY